MESGRFHATFKLSNELIMDAPFSFSARRLSTGPYSHPSLCTICRDIGASIATVCRAVKALGAIRLFLALRCWMFNRVFSSNSYHILFAFKDKYDVPRILVRGLTATPNAAGAYIVGLIEWNIELS